MATMVGTQKEIHSLLNALIELDYDAIEAYRAAVDRLANEEDRVQMRTFMGDHERHVRDLTTVVTSMGQQVSKGPDLKSILTKGKVVLGGLMGDRAILMAMKTNEDDTNVAYERAVARRELPSHVLDLLRGNLDDERRHRAWIEQRLAVFREEHAHR